MEETIVVNWDVNVTSGSECLTLDYLECETMEEWEALDKEEQRERIQNALDELPERTSIVVDDWS
jgi:DNA-directed RNA polymerase specialized sigma24 family protein